MGSQRLATIAAFAKPFFLPHRDERVVDLNYELIDGSPDGLGVQVQPMLDGHACLSCMPSIVFKSAKSGQPTF